MVDWEVVDAVFGSVDEVVVVVEDVFGSVDELVGD